MNHWLLAAAFAAVLVAPTAEARRGAVSIRPTPIVVRPAPAPVQKPAMPPAAAPKAPAPSPTPAPTPSSASSASWWAPLMVLLGISAVQGGGQEQKKD